MCHYLVCTLAKKKKEKKSKLPLCFARTGLKQIDDAEQPVFEDLI
jgi:hypothetical protein